MPRHRRKADLSLVPMRRQSARDMVAGQLSQLILGKTLSPGDRLPPETELCERLNVGRSTIREALLSLSARGILEIQHGKGAFVAKVPAAVLKERLRQARAGEAQLEEVWAVREALETRIAMFAAERRTPKDLRHLDEAVRAMDVAVAGGGTGQNEDTLFHHLLVVAAGAPLLGRLLDDISPFIAQTRLRALGVPGRPETSTREHRSIVDAVRLSDPILAGRRMYEHLSFGRRLTTRVISSEQEGREVKKR